MQTQSGQTVEQLGQPKPVEITVNLDVAGPRNKTDSWHPKGLPRVWQLSTRWNCRRQLACFEPRETVEKLRRDCQI